jgi:hypothetical protein
MARKKKKTKIPCLGGCGKKFLSSDPIYNRICPNCRARNANICLPEPAETLTDYDLSNIRRKLPS